MNAITRPYREARPERKTTKGKRLLDHPEGDTRDAAFDLVKNLADAERDSIPMADAAD